MRFGGEEEKSAETGVDVESAMTEGNSFKEGIYVQEADDCRGELGMTLTMCAHHVVLIHSFQFTPPSTIIHQTLVILIVVDGLYKRV